MDASRLFSQDDKYAGPSERIGRYYRQKLEELDGGAGAEAGRTHCTDLTAPSHHRAQGLGGWSPLPPAAGADGGGGRVSGLVLGAELVGARHTERQREAREAAEGVAYSGTKRPAHITDPVALQQRMSAYVRDGINPDSLAQFNNAWMTSAMEQVPAELSGVDPDQVDLLLQDMVEEVHHDYYDAVKESMVEYVLKSSVEGRRLEITQPVPKFELKTFHPEPGPERGGGGGADVARLIALGAWHDAVLTGYETVERTLVVNDDGMLTMLDLWTNYEHLMLCSLNGLPLVAAMELERFKEMQHTHCEKVVQTLKKKWFPSVLDIFRRDGRDDEQLSPSLLAAVSTLMFNQLRQLLAGSIEALVAFFETFAADDAADDPEPSAEKLHSQDVSHRPLFVVKMLTEAEGYKFSPSLPSLLKSVLGIVDHFVAMLNTVPRIEAELGKAPGAPRLLSIAAADDEVVVHAKARLEAILKTNYACTEGMHAVFAPLQYLLTAETDKKVADFNGAAHSLAEVTAEVAKYDKAKKEADKKARPEVRFTLLTVSCGAVKAKLVARADEMCEKLRLHVKGQFTAKCAELCSRYMDIFMRLGIHPTTEEEMVGSRPSWASRRGCSRRSTASSTRRASRCASSPSRRSASRPTSCRASATPGAGPPRSSPRSPSATSGSRRSATARRRS